MPVTVYSCATHGFEGQLIEVEVDIIKNAPAMFVIVGLGDAGVQEARERVRSAIKHTQLNYPLQKKVVNLAPASLRKRGPAFDLPIAVGILAASGQFPLEILETSMFVGELSLDGQVRAVTGILAMAAYARRAGFKKFFVPADAAHEASLIDGLEIVPLHQLSDIFLDQTVCDAGGESLAEILGQSALEAASEAQEAFSAIRGQYHAKRALQIAAAGGHHVLMVGPPGTGKTMLAHAAAKLLPPLSVKECIETSQVYSLAGLLSPERPFISVRPFRAPHCKTSEQGMLGGGALPRPGEISLAHNGILFLDEMGEFAPSTLESLRQPLESGEITITRSQHTATFPARFSLIAATNPCPCGHLNDPHKDCRCRAADINRYRKRFSGPLLDRIDLTVPVFGNADEIHEEAARNPDELAAPAAPKNLVMSIANARMWAQKRASRSNATGKARTPQLTSAAQDLLTLASRSLSLSMRAYEKTISVARTIADLAQSGVIEEPHIAEALSYRMFDKTV